MMDTLRAIRASLFSFLETNPAWLRAYLKVATFFASNGLRPPLTGGTKIFLDNWINQSLADECYSPAWYEKEDSSLRHLFEDLLPVLAKDAAILEVGCNCGRSLNYLSQRGYKNLHGIEIGQAAVDHMKKIFPETYAHSAVEVGSAPDVIKKHPTKKYDLVFCHSVLVNIPAEFNDVFYHMARVAKRFVVTIENEGSWKSYPRNFQTMFEAQGFKQVAYKLLVTTSEGMELPDHWDPNMVLNNNVLRVFVRE